jgi:hypothetical protein
MIKNNNMIKKSKIEQIINKLYPTYVYDSVESIPYFVFDKYNIKLIMIDMDNTLIDYNVNYNDEIKKWIKGLKKKGIKLYILSNSKSSEIVKNVAHKLGMQYYLGAKKPFLKGFSYILEKEKIEKQHAIMIGDQIFTDIWGGNRFGIKTILVNPIGKKEALITKVKRPFEKILLKKYYRRREE